MNVTNRDWSNREWRWHSYEPILKYICEVNKPKYVLEWGPGKSTKVILDNTDAKILTIEHQEEYYNKSKNEFENNPNVEIVYRPLGIKPTQSIGYINYPIFNLLNEGSDLKKYDLIFVDGRHRFDCIISSRFILNDGGIVLLHDAHREIYLPAIETFSYYAVLDDFRTAIMSNNPINYLESFEG
jgi:predicted O-methyltransferase YrrM